MGIFVIKNLSCLLDSTVMIRVGLYRAGDSNACFDSSDVQDIEIKYSCVSGKETYTVIDYEE